MKNRHAKYLIRATMRHVGRFSVAELRRGCVCEGAFDCCSVKLFLPTKVYVDINISPSLIHPSIYHPYFTAMTTNLASIAGPSRQLQPQPPKMERASSIGSGANSPPEDLRATVSVSKPGLSVGENGEVVKVPAFLNKLFR